MRFNKKKTSIIALLLAASLMVVFPIQMVKAQTTTVDVTPQTSTPAVGQTITISIQLNNVQNLYGIALTLNWNPSMLSLQANSNQTFIGTSNGVLNTPTSVFQDSASQAIGEFDLAAVSESPATSFSGSGTIATMKFTVTNAGDSNLTLVSTLANYAPGGTSEPIAHTDVSGTVDATSASGSSSPTTSPTSSPSPSATVPEFPLITTLSIVVALASVAVAFATKKIVKPTNISGIKLQS